MIALMVYHFITTIFCLHACVYEKERYRDREKQRQRQRNKEREERERQRQRIFINCLKIVEGSGWTGQCGVGYNRLKSFQGKEGCLTEETGDLSSSAPAGPSSFSR